MKYKNFSELRKKFYLIMGLDNYEEGLLILENSSEVLPREEYEKGCNDIMHMKAYAYCMCKKYDESLDAIEGLVERELVCGPWLINMLPNKKSERLIEIKEKNDILMTKAREIAQVKFFVHLPDGYTKEKRYPLFFALHGGGQSVEEFSYSWKPDIFLNKGYIVVYIQSSQVSWHNGYNWNDEVIVRQDIKECYDLILRNYSIDTDCILIGGYCGGAIAVMDVVMANVIPAKGFVVLHPEEKTESFTRENVELAKQRGLRGVIMEGELLLPIKDEAEIINVFNQVGFIHEFYICKGEGLSIPDNISDKLDRALEFLI